MLIMVGRYRDRGLFARPFCDLAFPMGSASPFWGQNEPERPEFKKSGQEIASLHRQKRGQGLACLAVFFVMQVAQAANLR